MTINKINNFKKTLWLREQENSSAAHQLFIKEHCVKKQEEEYPKGQTLFVLNIPPTVKECDIKQTFGQYFKSIRSVTFSTHLGTSKTGFKTAYIVFNKESDLKKVLSLPQEYVLTLCTDYKYKLLGIKKWCKEYNESLGDENEMKKEIDDYMLDYDERIKAEEDKEKNELEDEDGWVTVKGTKKRGQYATARKESVLNKLENKKEDKKKTQLLNFYTFQIRESKKQHLADLRKKFEMDKLKLQQFKQKRRFKPY